MWCPKMIHVLGGFKKALLQNPREMVRGRIFSEPIRVSAQKSELQAKSWSYSRADPQNLEPNHPEKAPEWGLGASTQKPPLQPS